MVIYDNIKMFDIAVECGAAINILNNQQLTPLSTASFLARTEMFFHIANLEREVYWQIGEFCFLKHNSVKCFYNDNSYELQFYFVISPSAWICLYHMVTGNVTCSAYPIEQLDSINSKTGDLNEVSALNLIVFGVRFSKHCLDIKYTCGRNNRFLSTLINFKLYLFYVRTKWNT